MKKRVVIGIDFHKKNTQICVYDLRGKISEETRISSSSESLRAFFRNRPKALIGVEISGGVFHLVSILKDCGHEVKILKPSAAKPFRGFGKKTDREDARALGKALLSGVCEEIHFKEEGVRVLNAVLSSREMVIKERVMLVNHVRGLLREFGQCIAQGMHSFLKAAPSMIASLTNDVLKNSLQSTLERIQHLRQEEKKITQSVVDLYRTDERMERLQEIPGIGPITSLCLMGSLGSLDRFESAHQVSSYLGLCPRQNSSGEKKRFGPITKAGCGLTRKNLIHGARSFLSRGKKEDAMLTWAKNLHKSQAPMNVKAVALASKMARVAFTILKSGSHYDSKYAMKRPEKQVA